LHAPSHCLTEGRPTPIDLAQGSIAAVLGDGIEVINPLDIVKLLAECVSHEGIKAYPGAGEALMDQPGGV
jgi:hypothetical protein